MSEAPDGQVENSPDGMLKLDRELQLPPVLDVLIVGGGPFGTAAAFRLKELNLSALVIDYDDILKRIRDYAKDKQILPDYGGGDRMKFPKAGELVASLHFAPIDKDHLCRTWKQLYRRFSVPAQVGVELTGLERDGSEWKVTAWNHNTKREQVLKARHVVLGFGRGVPRRIDIPGDVTGLAFALSDPAKYVGSPACVMGGGTSAAEAVIALSNAKIQAGDPSEVFWSYRGDKMPKVSKALADPFFDAFMGNGNIRYLPGSDPTSIITTGDESWLAIRTSRTTPANKPVETSQLEFLKKFCIACIGEDIPEALLKRVGVPLVTGGPANAKHIAVTPLLETRQPNVYLAGDVLSPAYFETSDFESDPAQFTEVKRRGNIKAAMRDGVLVAEVIAQKLAGKVVIDVKLNFDEAPAAPVTVREPEKPSKPKGNCVLVNILPTGVEANEYPVKPDGVTTLGRVGTDVAFVEDQTLADLHASILGTAGNYMVKDEGGRAGTLFQSRGDRPVELTKGSLLRAGRQWLMVGDKQGPLGVSHYDAAGRKLAQFLLREGTTTIVGRQSPDVTIAPDDGSLSRRHFSLTVKNGIVSMRDLGSANGTQVRVSSAALRLRHGDRILIGLQVLEFRNNDEVIAPSQQVTFNTGISKLPRPLPPPPQAAKQQPQAAASGPGVSFKGVKPNVACTKGQTVCEVAEKAGIRLEADCHQGMCAMDPIKVINGAEHLNAIGGQERMTLESLSLEAGPYRLACMARISGPVEVEILKP